MPRIEPDRGDAPDTGGEIEIWQVSLQAQQNEVGRIREKLDAACKCILDLRVCVLELHGTVQELRGAERVIATGTAGTIKEALDQAFEALRD